MPIVSLLDLEQSLKLNQFLFDAGLSGAANATSNLNLLLKSSANNLTSASSASILANALLQQLQLQQQQQQQQQQLATQNKTKSVVNNSNNSILLNCIKSNLALQQNQDAINQTSSASTKQINYSRYKTELCRQFSENGECKYGDKCQFAHGINDLKDVNRHPKYKTDYCKTFHSKGFCPYGPRCHFIHEFYEKTDVTSNKTSSATVVAAANTNTNTTSSNDLLFLNSDKLIKSTNTNNNNQLKTSNNKSSSLLLLNSNNSSNNSNNLDNNNILSDYNQMDKQLEAIQALFNTTTPTSNTSNNTTSNSTTSLLNDDLVLNDNTININTSSSSSNDILTDLLNSNSSNSNSNSNQLDLKTDKFLDPLDEFDPYIPSSFSSTLKIDMPSSCPNFRGEMFEKENFFKLLNRVKLHSSETSSLCSPNLRTRTCSTGSSSLSTDLNEGIKSPASSYFNPLSDSDKDTISSLESKPTSQFDDFKFEQFFSFNHL